MNDNKGIVWIASYPKSGNTWIRSIITSMLYAKDRQFNFELIKKVPFLPNSLLVFPRTNYSFHGVEKINENQSERNLIQLNYYLKQKNNP